ncbi:MAG: glycosyltransferase family 2 protein [Planctomycetota bacterium]
MSGESDAAPLISVCIPVYNREDLVDRTIDSVLGQSMTDFEIVAVNDGSKDGSLAVLRRYETDHPAKFRVVDQQNKGLAGARNTGAAHARGEYLLFLDSDDLLFPWSLEAFAEAIERHGRPAMVSGEFPPFDDDLQLGRFERRATTTRYFGDYLSTRARATGIAPSGTIVRRDAYERTGASDEVRVMFEDVDIWFKVGAEKGYAHIDAPPVVGYRVGHAQMMGNMQKQLDGFDWIAGKVERGEYETGTSRRAEMKSALAKHAKGCAFRCLHAGDKARAMAFYKRSMGAQLAAGELKFLLAFPVLALLGRGVTARPMRELAKQTTADE